MRVLIFAPHYWPATRAGGPARSLTNLAREAARHHEVVVVTADRDLGDPQPFEETTGTPVLVDGVSVHYVDTSSVFGVLGTIRSLPSQEYDLVVLNSLWNRALSFVPALALLARRLHASRVVLMPRGAVEPGALALKTKRKKIAAGLVKFVYGRAATVVAATSPQEAANLRRWFPRHPCLLVSNTPDEIQPGYVEPSGDDLRLLFLGRVHPTKGLKELLQALVLTTVPCQLVIAGPLEDSRYWQECEDLISRLPGSTQARHFGPVIREQLPELLWRSDLLVTLTLGENFGHTIAESLQAGCPVMVTETTPWTDFLACGGGILVPDRGDSAAISRHLQAFFVALVADRKKPRERARAAFDAWQSQRPADVVVQALGSQLPSQPGSPLHQETAAAVRPRRFRVGRAASSATDRPQPARAAKWGRILRP